MGRYIQKKKKPDEKSIVETLNEAEHDHFLDCPDAEYRARIAAFILDAIFLTLLISGINRLCLPAYAYLRNNDFTLNNWGFLVQATQWALQVAGSYFYLVTCAVKYGGTAGKLLLDLRVVDHRTGKTLSPSQATLREFIGKPLCVLSLGIGFFLILMRADSRGLHDLLGRSVVKKNEWGQ